MARLSRILVWTDVQALRGPILGGRKIPLLPLAWVWAKVVDDCNHPLDMTSGNLEELKKRRKGGRCGTQSKAEKLDQSSVGST